MRFALVDQAKKGFPVPAFAGSSASARAAILPGRIVRLAGGNAMTW